MNRNFPWLPLVGLALSTVAFGCDDQPTTTLAPTASALAPSKPSSADSKKFAIDKPSSKVEFTMDAPQEKIRGRIAGASEGAVNIDPTDVSKTTGLVNLDLTGIELYQTTMDDKGNPQPETKSELQNKHVRTWLEISDDTPEDVRKKNAHVEFSIKTVEDVQPGKDVTKMTGADRKVVLKTKGDLLLHGRQTEQTAELEATFHYDGDKLVSVAVKTTKPFAVGLAEHDVRPREGFSKLAAKTLELLAPKVAKDASVSIAFTALAPGMAAPPPEAAAPAASASAAPAAASAAPSASAASKPPPKK